MSIYQAISLDIAQRIVNNEFPVRTKLSGRTLLAGQYHVSSETIRKAISLLKEAGIVDVSQGKEITIVSVDKAVEYINRHNAYIEPVYSLKQELELLLKEKKRLDAKFDEILHDIINFSDRLKNLTPYNPVEIEISYEAHVIGKTIADIKLWQNTGATIVALKRGTGMILSPGPHIRLQVADRIVVVGDHDVYERTMNFVNRRKAEIAESNN
ncbi:TrkA C-terminal domain-containing protein [Effusibacillus lacus]|nr:TrkA C-terminal domain-containing protein [Effusibacillus lacus]